MKKGKCINRAGCLLGYRGEILTAPEDNFVCRECRKPLQPVTKENPSLSLFKKAALGLLCVLILLVLLLGAGLFMKLKRLEREPATPTASSEPTQVVAEPTATPTPAQPPIATAAALPPASQPAGAPPEPPASNTQVVSEATPNLDLANQANQTTKTEVLKRIDLMPTISAGNKDKLYVSVERARQMGRIISIPFSSGKTALSNADGEKLKSEILAPQIQALLQDPTAVFVVLGFADTKGDEKTNIRISQERADSTLRVLRDKCGVANVLHAVAMGGSTLFDDKGLEKNRTAEVWVVLP